MWTNVTGIDYIDIFVGGYPQNVFGDIAFTVFMGLAVVILLFVAARAPRETILFAPGGTLIIMSQATGIMWLKPILFIIGGIYLAGVFIILFREVRD